MKLAVFSDLHITNANSKFKVNTDGVSDLLTAQLQFVEWMIADAKEQGCDMLLFLGDITDRATLDPITQTYFNKMMYKLVYGHDMDTILLEGNHCTADSLNRYSVLGAARHLLSGGNLVTTREELTFIDDGVHYTFHIFPYQPDYRALEVEIGQLNDILVDSTDVDILLFHFPCSNAQLDNGVPSPKGVHLSADITSNFDLCLGGDFHRSQWLSGNDKAYYVGAPFNLKFNEQTDEPRGYAIFTKDAGGWMVERGENPYNYEMLSVQAEEAEQYVGHFTDPSRVILQVKGRLDPDTKLALEEEGFYRFSNVKTSGNVAPAVLLETVVDLDYQEDEDLVIEQLDDESVSEEVRERALELFSRIQNDGE